MRHASRDYWSIPIAWKISARKAKQEERRKRRRLVEQKIHQDFAKIMDRGFKSKEELEEFNRSWDTRMEPEYLRRRKYIRHKHRVHS